MIALLLKRGLILFWATWTTIVTATNIFDALMHLGYLPETWSFASGNFAFMVEVTSVHHTPTWVVAILFGGVIIWEGLAAILLWYLLIKYHHDRNNLLYLAFGVSLALWSGFMIAEEIFLSYKVEAVHRSLLTSQLITLLVIRLLPDDEENG